MKLHAQGCTRDQRTHQTADLMYSLVRTKLQLPPESAATSVPGCCANHAVHVQAPPHPSGVHLPRLNGSSRPHKAFQARPLLQAEAPASPRCCSCRCLATSDMSNRFSADAAPRGAQQRPARVPSGCSSHAAYAMLQILIQSRIVAVQRYSSGPVSPHRGQSVTLEDAMQSLSIQVLPFKHAMSDRYVAEALTHSQRRKQCRQC